MNVIYADQKFDNVSGPSIFLAGPTPRDQNVKSWRPEAIDILKGLNFNGTVFSPEQSTNLMKFDYDAQVEWEFKALNQAQCVVFWVPRDLKTMPALTTNVEAGLWFGSGKNVFYGRPDNAPKNRYLDWLYGKLENKKYFNNLNDLLKSACSSFETIKSNIFVTADWHIGEKRMAIMQRPFNSTEEQTELLIKNHNSVVGLDDLVIVDGDVITNQKEVSEMEIYLPVISRFNGRKILIRGNHDRKLTNEQFSPYFEKIIDEGEGLDLIDTDGLQLYITHYPTKSVDNKFNLIGHIHSAWKVQKNMLNVGVDVHSFYPVPINENTKFTQTPSFFLNAITNFYDDDVFCSNNYSNTLYNDRGKKGKYF